MTQRNVIWNTKNNKQCLLSIEIFRFVVDLSHVNGEYDIHQHLCSDSPKMCVCSHPNNLKEMTNQMRRETSYVSHDVPKTMQIHRTKNIVLCRSERWRWFERIAFIISILREIVCHDMHNLYITENFTILLCVVMCIFHNFCSMVIKLVKLTIILKMASCLITTVPGLVSLVCNSTWIDVFNSFPPLQSNNGLSNCHFRLEYNRFDLKGFSFWPNFGQ